MSGGHYDYASFKLNDFIESLEVSPENPIGVGYEASPELRERFREHLKLVQKAMRAIEWNDSGDGDRDEVKLIEACLSGATKLEGQ